MNMLLDSFYHCAVLLLKAQQLSKILGATQWNSLLMQTQIKAVDRNEAKQKALQ